MIRDEVAPIAGIVITRTNGTGIVSLHGVVSLNTEPLF